MKDNKIYKLSRLMKKKILSEKIIIDYRREVKLLYWSFVRRSAMDLIYSTLIDICIHDNNDKDKDVVTKFFNKITNNNIEYVSSDTITKEFKIPKKGIIINNDDIKLEKDIHFLITVTIASPPADSIEGMYDDEKNELTVFCRNVIHDKNMLDSIFDNRYKFFISRVRNLYPVLMHELTHVVKENSSMSEKNNPSSFKYNASNFSAKSYYTSDTEYETTLFTVFSSIKKRILESKKKMKYRYFFETLPSGYSFLYNLREYRIDKFVEAMYELFDLLKDNYLIDDGYGVPRWIKMFKRHK